jgi:hypothetical protein
MNNSTLSVSRYTTIDIKVKNTKVNSRCSFRLNRLFSRRGRTEGIGDDSVTNIVSRRRGKRLFFDGLKNIWIFPLTTRNLNVK